MPVRKAAPGHDVVLRATVGGLDRAPAARVCFSSDERPETCIPMQPIGPWRVEAVIPAEAVTPGLNYVLEATPSEGSGEKAGQTASPPATIQRIAIVVSDDAGPPEIHHTPITTAPPGQPLAISATVRDPSGIAWVRLRYRNVTQYEDYQTLEMVPAGKPDTYAATVPGEAVGPRHDFMYFIEAMDAAGNGTIYPDLEIDTPYVVVRLER